MHTLIGNLISLVASVIMTTSGFFKSQKKTLFWQSIQISLNALSCFVLKAYSGAIVNCLSLPRNILAYKEKLTPPVKLIIGIITVVLSVIFNSTGIIGYLPIISTVVYISLMDKLKDAPFKLLVIFTLILWGIHDFYVKNYVQSFFDVACIVTSAIAIWRIRKEQSNASKEGS